MQNLDIRLLVSKKRIYYKDIASVMGIQKTSLSRILSKELKPKQREKILFAINTIEAKGKEQ